MTRTMPEKQSGNDLGQANSPSGSPDTRTAPKPPQITCSCGAGWRSRRAAHCAACHLTFSSDSAFDAHRRAGQCLDPATATRRDGTPRFQARSDTSAAALWGLPGTWTGPDNDNEEDDQ